MRALSYGEIPAEELSLSEIELSSRLGYRAGVNEEPVRRLTAELLSVCDVKYGAVLVDAEYGEGWVDFGFGKINSAALVKNLRKSARAYRFAVTLGIGVDRLIRKRSVLSPSEGFILDAIGSALAESAADVAERKIHTGKRARPRFSPGYADFSLSHQREILALFDSEKNIGITLLDSGLMIPQKSITAVVGIAE